MKAAWHEEWDVIDPDLGSGGQGTTQLLRSRADADQRAVLKELKNKKKPQARARFHQEAAGLATLHSLGLRVPEVFQDGTVEFAETNAPLYLIMEYIEGETLDARVKREGPLSLDEAIRLSVSLCDTIAGAHDVGVVHRDLKPSNLILRRTDGELYVVDFGLTTLPDSDKLTRLDEKIHNEFMTLNELLHDNPARRDPRVDIVCIAGLLYFMITGHYCGPLDDGNGRAPHQRDGRKVTTSIGSDGVVRAVERFLDRGLAPRLDHRYQTVAELRADLTQLNSASEAGDLTLAEAIAISSERIRTGSARSRIRETRTHASEFFNRFTQEIRRKLSPQFEQAGLSFNVSSDVPKPLEPVPNVLQQLTLHLASQTDGKCKLYRTYLFRVLAPDEAEVRVYESIRANKTTTALGPARPHAILTSFDDSEQAMLVQELTDWLVGALKRLADALVDTAEESS